VRASALPAPALLVVALALVVVALLPVGRGGPGGERWRRLFPPVEDPHRPPRSLPVRLVALVGGGGVALLVGGWWGAALGVASWLAVRQLVPRLESAAARRRRRALAAQAPDVLDLLVACLASGSTVPAAVEATAAAVAAPAADVLGVVAAQLRLGADPVAAWAPVAAEPPFAALAASVARSADSGAALADALADAADELRARRRSEVESAARRIGVRLTAPLGLAFLPAFVLLGIVPVVASLIVGALSLP
jgi:pilus assembly protein TadC